MKDFYVQLKQFFDDYLVIIPNCPISLLKLILCHKNIPFSFKQNILSKPFFHFSFDKTIDNLIETDETIKDFDENSWSIQQMILLLFFRFREQITITENEYKHNPDIFNFHLEDERVFTRFHLVLKY